LFDADCRAAKRQTRRVSAPRSFGIMRFVDAQSVAIDQSSYCSAADRLFISRRRVEKVSKVRATTCGVSTPTFSTVCDRVSLPHIAISINDVIRSTRQLLLTYFRNTSSSRYDLLAPFVEELFNRLLAAGCFPSSFKVAFITIFTHTWCTQS